MKKIIKRLLTGVLTLATVFTALPVTQVHAADSVYTTTDGKAGTIVKVDNSGTEIKSFEESIMTADGQTAYCVDINTNFESGYKNRVDAKDRMSDDQISDVALNLEYVKQYSKTHSLSSKQVYLLEQCVVWRRLSIHLGWGYNNVRAAYDEVSEKIQSEVYENAKAFAKANKDRYDCGGYIYVGEGQDLGQFWAKLAVGDGKIQKSSSNTAITKSSIITMHTTATDKATGKKTIEAGKSVTIVDTVTLDGLEKGTKYTLKGWEMVKSENAELIVNGKRVENDLTFTATDSKMEVQIAFTFNASELGGKELVTFEELYDTTNPDEPIKVAEHKDIKDKGQTVTITEKPESPTTPDEPSTPTRTGTSPKTGDNTPFVALFAMMGISAAGLIFAGYKRFRRVKKSK